MNRLIPQDGSRNIIESILILFFFVGLMFALYDVMEIFFGVLTFALIFAVSFSDLFERFVRALGNRRTLAAVLYTCILLAIIAVPSTFLLSSLRRHIKDGISWMEEIKAHGLPPLPGWLSGLPFVGSEIDSFWTELQSSPKDAIAPHAEQLRKALHHILTSGAGMMGTALQFVIGIGISAFFLAAGKRLMNPIRSTLQHLLGRRDGLSLLVAIIQAIKSVSIGVMGTAFIAAVLSWIGLTIAGIGFSLLFSAIVFFLVLLQLGPMFVWVPIIVWAASQGHTGKAVFLIIYGVGLVLVDALLKPILIAKSGGKIPFLVLFLGVIGGLAAWGFTGMFKGAVILSVFYTLFNSWLEKKRSHPHQHTTL